MKIFSDEKDTVLEIFRNYKNDPYSTYTLKIAIQCGANHFSAQNDDIYFSGLDIFLKNFSNFLKHRSGTLRLEATEGCSIEFFPWNARGTLGLRVCISKYAIGYDPAQSCPISLSATFKLDSELASQVYEDFKNLDEED